MVGKTGTTTDEGDAWFVGWTPQFTTAVWVGFPNRLVPMLTQFNGGPVTGGTFPAEIWRAYMELALQINAEEHPPKPKASSTSTATSGDTSTYDYSPSTATTPQTETAPPRPRAGPRRRRDDRDDAAADDADADADHPGPRRRRRPPRRRPPPRRRRRPRAAPGRPAAPRSADKVAPMRLEDEIRSRLLSADADWPAYLRYWMRVASGALHPFATGAAAMNAPAAGVRLPGSRTSITPARRTPSHAARTVAHCNASGCCGCSFSARPTCCRGRSRCCRSRPISRSSEVSASCRSSIT